MISLKGRRPAEPPAFRAPLPGKLAHARQAVAAQVAQGQSELTFEPHWGDFKQHFDEAQHGGKCPYCETRFPGATYGDVEHYRPKAEVSEYDKPGNRSDLDGKPPARKKRVIKKPGYWWLAYQWHNYLWVCDRCNTWKGNQFPIQESWCEGPLQKDGEAQETPLLLNPFDEDPAPHLDFNEFGVIRGRTMRGEKTIEVCGLDRGTLERERERAARALRRLGVDYVLALETKNEHLRRSALRGLLERCEPEEPYAGMAREVARVFLKLTYEELMAALEREGDI